MQENLQAFIYKKIKNTSRNPEKLPECHCIGKIQKYPWISLKIPKMPLAARVAHARLLLAAGRFSGEISGKPMVDPGRSDVEDSYGGGLDGRWWLMSENRRLEASVAANERGPFSAKWGGENAETSRGFALYEDSDLSVVVWKLDIPGDGRSEEREGVAGERREMLWVTLRWER